MQQLVAQLERSPRVPHTEPCYNKRIGDEQMNLLKDFANKYSYSIEFDSEDNIYIARCAELPTLFAHGKTQEKALKEIKTAILVALEWMQEDKEEISLL